MSDGIVKGKSSGKPHSNLLRLVYSVRRANGVWFYEASCELMFKVGTA